MAFHRSPSPKKLEYKAVETWLDAPHTMIWMTDKNHLCVYCNQALLDYFGFSMKDSIGLEWLNLIHPDDREKVTQTQKFAAAHYQNYRQEYRAKGKSREDYIWVLDISVPRFGPKGEFLGYIASIMDITGQKNQEEALKNKQKVLEREILKISDREKSNLGHDLHDELSQLLLGIALKSMLLERKLKKRKLPESAVAKQITAEINRVLAKTRMVSQSLFPPSLRKKNLLFALKELTQKIRHSFQVDLKIKMDPKYPTLSPEKAIHLYRIVQEAVTNSIRHGKARHIEVAIEGGFMPHRLEIRDDGSGIPDTLPDNGGMGLHIMEYRARMLGGKIEMQSLKSGGTLCKCTYFLEREQNTP